MYSYFTANIVPSVSDEGLTWFCAQMYHGTHDRRGRRPAIGDVPEPIRLSKNLAAMAHVLVPSATLIVSGRVRKLLEESSCRVEFVPVEFARTFYYDYDLGMTDVDAANDPAFQAAIDQCHRTDIPPALPEFDYFEVLMHEGAEVFPCYDDRREVAIAAESIPGIASYSLSISLAAIHDYGIVRTDEGFLVGGELFERLRRFLPEPYFWTQHFRDL